MRWDGAGGPKHFLMIYPALFTLHCSREERIVIWQSAISLKSLLAITIKAELDSSSEKGGT